MLAATLSKRETDVPQEFVARIRAALDSTLREVRLSSDYSDFVEITQDEVVRIKGDVHAFVAACREYLVRVEQPLRPPSGAVPAGPLRSRPRR